MSTLIQAVADGSWPATICVVAICAAVVGVYWVMFRE